MGIPRSISISSEHRIAYSVLQDIDQSKDSEAVKEQKRIDELAYKMLDRKEVRDSFIKGYDDVALDMGDDLVKGFMVTYSDNNDNVFGLYHKWCTYKYHWEHQAYEDWITFRNAVYSQYIAVASVERLSLLARIKVLKEKNEDHSNLDKTLAGLNAQIDEVNKKFNDKKDSWAGIVQKRPDNQRYYWTPDNEKLLYTEAHQQKVPVEKDNDKYGADDMGKTITDKSKIRGVVYKGWLKFNPVYDFWRPFTSYARSKSDGGGIVKCPTVEWYQQVYKDYGKKVDLYTIFFDKNEGNMKAPKGSGSGWKFVCDPATGHEMKYYWGSIIHEDQIVTPVVRSDSTEIKDARDGLGTDIYWYHNSSSEISPGIVKKGSPYIGIGVVNGYLNNGEMSLIGKTITVSEKIQLKAKATKNGFNLSWTKAEKADKYTVYQKMAGKKTFKKIRTISNPDRNKLFISKSKLKNKKGYVYYVKATGKAQGKTITKTSWKVVVYPANGKYTNVKSLTLKKGIKSTMTLKKGKTRTLGAKVKKVNASKKLPPKFKAIRYLSTNKKIATVSASGRITAKDPGVCHVYAYGTNGIAKKVRVTVK